MSDDPDQHTSDTVGQTLKPAPPLKEVLKTVLLFLGLNLLLFAMIYGFRMLAFPATGWHSFMDGVDAFQVIADGQMISKNHLMGIFYVMFTIGVIAIVYKNITKIFLSIVNEGPTTSKRYDLLRRVMAYAFSMTLILGFLVPVPGAP